VPSITARRSIEVLIGPDEWAAELRRDARAGLTSSPKVLPPTWLYDDLGSVLFDAITRVPEYYPTRTERAILAAHADEIAALTQADTLVELGSGTSAKTRLLLDAMAGAGHLRRFVPFDVAEPTLRAAADAIGDAYDPIEIVGIVGDFRRHLSAIPGEGRRLVAFLGGTIGNLVPTERAMLLADLAAVMAPGDSLLVGTDLVKDPQRLVQAYDDAAGVTAAFDKNVLTILNRELGADFDASLFDHVARFDTEHEWIEMRLRSRVPQVVHIDDLDVTITFDEGEELRTEVSAKFRPDGIDAELRTAGFEPVRRFVDANLDFALTLAQRPGEQ
jgi:L-histidine Nalpha-methyltransferase